MAKRGAWETVRLQGEQIVDEVRRVVHEGNVRRVVVKQKGQVVAEFPLTVGVVASVVAPVLAAIGALVALLTDCSIDLERRSRLAGRDEEAEEVGHAEEGRGAEEGEEGRRPLGGRPRPGGRRRLGGPRAGGGVRPQAPRSSASGPDRGRTGASQAAGARCRLRGRPQRRLPGRARCGRRGHRRLGGDGRAHPRAPGGAPRGRRGGAEGDPQPHGRLALGPGRVLRPRRGPRDLPQRPQPRGVARRPCRDRARREAGGRVLVAVFTPDTDLEGQGKTPVPGVPHLYDRRGGRRMYLVDPETLDRDMARLGLEPVEPTVLAEGRVEVGRRVSANGLYRKAKGAARLRPRQDNP